MSRPFYDLDQTDEQQPELGFAAPGREADEREAPASAVERPGRAEPADRGGDPARSGFFRARRRSGLPVIGVVGALATVAFFLWLGREDPPAPVEPPAEELAAVAAAPGFVLPFPEAADGPLAPAPNPVSLAAPAEPGPELLEPAPASPPAPAAPAEPAPTAIRDAYSVQLLAARSAADVGASWEKLRSTHPDLLAALGPTVVRAQRDGDTFYRLRAGPLPDRSAADALCRALSARQQGCFVVSPGS